MEIVPHIQQGVNFFYVFLLFLLGIYVYFLQKNSGVVTAVFAEEISFRKFVKIKNYSTSGIVVSLLIISNFSFLLYEILNRKIIQFFPSEIGLLWCLLLVALCYFIERLFLIGISSLFGEAAFGKSVLQFYQINGLLFLFTSFPIMLLAICLPNYISDIMFQILIFLLIITWLLSLLRSVIMGRQLTKFSVLHIFLYLCTLKILPFLILSKIITLYAAD
ncbi:MAG: DUF4271 domain-containing protein [Bacteroidales bacterium]|jgi:hypothetical protein|nr:DUF4271 domain-containing protein [Bacteroidales bacterium]